MDAICGDGTDTVADHLCGRSAIVRSPVQVTCGIYFRRIVHFLCICEYYLCAFYYIQTHWKGSQCNSGHHSDSGFCRNLSDRDDTGVFPEAASAASFYIRNQCDERSGSRNIWIPLCRESVVSCSVCSDCAFDRSCRTSMAFESEPYV